MRALAALVLGESTWPPLVGLVRDPARVERVVPVAVFSAFSVFSVAALGATFLVRFLGTGSSEFSLSSPDISSLLRFFARAVLVALAYVGTVLVVLGLEVDLMRTSGEDAGREEGALGTALRGLRPAVPVPAVFLVAAVVVVAVVVVAVVVVTLVGGAGAVIGCTGADALRRLASVVWRVTIGMRLTRRSRRDCILAH